MLAEEARRPRPLAAAPTSTASPGAQAQLPADFPTLVDAVEQQGKQLLGLQLRDHVGLVSFAPGELVLKPLKPLGAEFARELAAAAKQATGANWEVAPHRRGRRALASAAGSDGRGTSARRGA